MTLLLSGSNIVGVIEEKHIKIYYIKLAMVKIHTRAKRKMGGASGLRKTRPETRKRKKRPRTFKSEEIAKKWAEAQGITDYELKNLRIGTKDKKIRVVVK